MKALDNLVEEIDRLITEADRGLNLAQPPMTGKIRIIWFKRDGGVYPRAVEWIRMKDGMWTTKDLPSVGLSRRAKVGGAFKHNHEAARRLLEFAGQLMQLRVEINKRRAALEQMLAFRGRQLSGMEGEIARLKARCEEENLRLAEGR